MNILIAPDKFKGCLSAREVSENIAMGLRDVLPETHIEIVPMADGGEDTAEVISDALGGRWITCRAHNPEGREIDCRYAFVDRSKLAVMEISEAAGMRRLQSPKREIERASTFGVGEMILHAAGHGAREMIVGLGGSVTNDGGFGMARALGFRFFGSDCDYEHEHELRERVSELLNLVRIEKARDLVLPKIVVAADVCNPLLGEQGATRIFGPQKGAAREQIDVLEKALSRLADVVAKEFGFDHRNEQGAGAGGGLGFGLMTFCGAIMRRGFDVVAETAGLETKMAKADVVITGEGSLDRQTFQGKAPGEVAKMSRRLGKPVFAVTGRAEQNQETQALFDNVYVLTQKRINEHESISRAPELLRERARELAHDL